MIITNVEGFRMGHNKRLVPTRLGPLSYLGLFRIVKWSTNSTSITVTTTGTTKVVNLA